MTKWHAVRALAGIVVALLLPSVAFADDVSRAAELKRRGDDLMVSLEYREALAAYEQAYAITADPALLYNRGRAHQALTEYPEALDLLERFAQAAPAELKARVPKLEELLSEVRARVAIVEVTCDVAGARVVVRGKIEATLPAEKPIRVRAGPAPIEVVADGYDTFHRDVDLPGAQTTTLDARLVRSLQGNLARLTIATKPTESFVALDGKAYGTSPLEATLATGSHTVVVHRDGFEDRQVGVTLAKGERRQLNVDLVPTPPSTSRWWFWTGMGAAITGGIVLSIALLTPRDAPSGSINPGQVRAP